MLVQSIKIWVVEDPRSKHYLLPRKDKRDYKKKHNGETEMNPSNAAEQWLARDREAEIRKEAYMEQSTRPARKEQNPSAPRGIPALLQLFNRRAEKKHTPSAKAF